MLYLVHRRIQAKNVKDDRNLAKLHDVLNFHIFPDFFFIVPDFPVVPDFFFVVQNLNARNEFGFDLQRLRTQSDSVVQKAESRKADFSQEKFKMTPTSVLLFKFASTSTL